MKSKMLNKILFAIGLLLYVSTGVNAQEVVNTSGEKNHKHSITVVLGHTHVPRGVPAAPDGGALIVPSWGINYDFRIAKKWSIGVHADMEIATYIIKGSDGTELERKRPTIISVALGYRPWKGLVVGLGFGNEFETHENFLVYRFGLEYAFEFSHDWEIAPGLTYDIKESTYDSWTIGLGVVRRF